MTDIKFLRRFNLVVFSILFVMGILVFCFGFEKLEAYMDFCGMVVKVLIPLVFIGFLGTPIEKVIENWRAIIEGKNGENK